MQSPTGYTFLRQGKVRDVYSADDHQHLLIVASDRISAFDHVLPNPIIIADTKFEFGLLEGDLILIDELFTPDSSRFWPSESYRPGTSPPSFDKQFVRDYLEQIQWDKQPPAPELPEDVIRKTSEKNEEALKRLTGYNL